MTTRRKPQKKIKFQLSRSGILGIGVVCFCLFLWMFLLGVWTGQSMVLPSTTPNMVVAKKEASNEAAAQRVIPNKAVQHIEATTKKKIYTQPDKPR